MYLEYRFMKMRKHYAITCNGKVVTSAIPIPETEAHVIYFNPKTQAIGNHQLAMQTDLTLESTTDEIKAVVKKYLALHYKLWSLVRYAKLKPIGFK